MHENPQMMAEMQQRIVAAAGRGGVDGETLTRNMQNQLMTGAGGGPLGMMGGLPGMTRGPAGLTSRFGAGRGGAGARPMMGGGLGGMMGLPPGMLSGRPGGPMGVPGAGPMGMPGGGPMGIPGADPRVMDAGLRPPPMDAGSRNMMGGGTGGIRRPPDVMHPPMGPSAVSTGDDASTLRRPADVMHPPIGPSTVSTADDMSAVRRPPDVMHPPMGPSTMSTTETRSSVPTATTSASDLLSGRPGGMVGSLATTPGSLILGQPASAHVPAVMPASESGGPPPAATNKPEPLPPPRMLDDDEERALLQGRGTLPPPRSADQPAPSTERPLLAAKDPEPARSEPRSRGRDEEEDHPVIVTGGAEACTACEAAGVEFGSGKKCPHAFCVSCVQSYFSHGETECPVCGINDQLTARTLTQPSSGHMITTYENGFKLPGFETTSRGTIIVTYSFPAGIQTVCLCTFSHRQHCFIVKLEV